MKEVTYIYNYFIGWYIVWKLFLCRFKFVRELVGTYNGDAQQSTGEKSATKKTKKVRLE